MSQFILFSAFVNAGLGCVPLSALESALGINLESRQ